MSDYISHLKRDDWPGTVCGEPWQGWQAPEAWIDIPDHRVVAPMEPPKKGDEIRQCQACMQAGLDPQRHHERLQAEAGETSPPAVTVPRLGEASYALYELVKLKDGPRDQAYRESKEAAWERARNALDALGFPSTRDEA